MKTRDEWESVHCFYLFYGTHSRYAYDRNMANPDISKASPLTAGPMIVSQTGGRSLSSSKNEAYGYFGHRDIIPPTVCFGPIYDTLHMVSERNLTALTGN